MVYVLVDQPQQASYVESVCEIVHLDVHAEGQFLVVGTTVGESDQILDKVRVFGAEIDGALG